MANKLYIAEEAVRLWTDAGNSPDEALDLGGLAAGAVAMGSFHDLGAAPRAQDYMWELRIDGFATAPVVGEPVLLYLAFSNATTIFDGEPTTDPTTTVEGTMTVAQLRNALFIGAATVYSTTAADELKVSGKVRITHRYVSPVVHNDTADALASASEFHSFKLWPIPPEIQ